MQKPHRKEARGNLCKLNLQAAAAAPLSEEQDKRKGEEKKKKVAGVTALNALEQRAAAGD